MIKLHVFIGLSAFNKNNFSYAYTVYDEFSTDSIFLMGDFVKNSTEHKAILVALKSILETFIAIKEQEEYHIIFYSDNNLISFEYNNEYKKENHFSEKTEDIEDDEDAEVIEDIEHYENAEGIEDVELCEETEGIEEIEEIEEFQKEEIPPLEKTDDQNVDYEGLLEDTLKEL